MHPSLKVEQWDACLVHICLIKQHRSDQIPTAKGQTVSMDSSSSPELVCYMGSLMHIDTFRACASPFHCGLLIFPE